MKTKYKSFTLIELVVCIGIIAVFLTVVRINFQNNNRNLAMEELNNVYEILNNSKNYSINTKNSISAIFDSKENSLKIDGKGYFNKKIYFKNLILMESVEILFNKNGNVIKGETISFSVGEKLYDITVRPATSYIDLKVNDEK